MVSASSAFKDAVKRGELQRPFLRFDDIVFTNEDISITSGGIKFDERFNEDTDLTIGTTPSSSLNASINNHDRLLTGYAFGRFTASIGVVINRFQYTERGNVTAIWNGEKVFNGNDSYPYLEEGYQPCAVQPDFPVKAIVLDGDVGYLFGENRRVFVFNARESSTNVQIDASNAIRNEFTWRKVDALVKQKKGIVLYGPYEVDFMPDQECVEYEYVKLGTFIAPRPSVLIKDVIDLDANDQMTLFDDLWMRNVPVAYPINIGGLMDAICAAANVQFVSQGFINSWVPVNALPEKLSDSTAREVIGKIAEAACSIARFNRDGQLEFAWFNDTDAAYDEHSYTDFTPLSYSVRPIQVLCVRNSEATADVNTGAGENVYFIQDNPFLNQYVANSENPENPENSDDSRDVTPNEYIYNRLAGFPAFSPSSADLFADWTMQAGDVITVGIDGNTYRMPVYSMSMQWSGSPKISASSSGNEKREPPPAQERKEFQSDQEIHTLNSGVGALGGRMDTAEHDIEVHAGKIQANADNIQLNADEIELRVKKSLVIEAINDEEQSEGSSVLIKADKIELDGVVSAVFAKIDTVVSSSVSTALANIGDLTVTALHTQRLWVNSREYSYQSQALPNGQTIYYLGFK